MGSAKGTTKSGGRKNLMDKFYTKPEVAAALIEKTEPAKFDVVIEPSAGSGAFSSQIPNCIALDLEPEGEGINRQDWFLYERERTSSNERVLVIGNPPFGQQNNLAIAFINHAARLADKVAFVLPISFKKESVQNRLAPNLHLIYEEDLPPNSFTLDGDDYDVRCVYQIWEAKEEIRHQRSRSAINSNLLFTFVKKVDAPDFSIQRVGGNAGKANSEWQEKSEQSNYFVRLIRRPRSKKQADEILARLNSIVYPSRDHAVGPRSLSKHEINDAVEAEFGT